MRERGPVLHLLAHAEPQRDPIKRNPNYVGPRPHHVDRMIFTVNAQPEPEPAPGQGGPGRLRRVRSAPAGAAQQLVKQFGVNKSRFFVHTSEQRSTTLALNTRRLKDVATRKAINYAIDRPALVRQSGAPRGHGRPTRSCRRTLPGYRDVPIYPLQWTERRQREEADGRTEAVHDALLAERPDRAEPGSGDRQSNLKAIGITVKVKTLPFSALQPAIGDPNEPYDIVLNGWFADYPDPVDFINVLLRRDQHPLAEQHQHRPDERSRS